jgi:hypothetical protein
MSSTHNIPTTDEAFNEKQVLVATQVIANASAWKINQDYLNNVIVPAKTLWETKYAAWLQPESRTPIATAQKNDAKDAYLVVFRPLVAGLLSNPYITQQALDTMGLRHPSVNHTPVSIPVGFPQARTDNSVPRRITLNFIDSITGKRAKPHGVSGAVVRYDVLEEAPIDINDLKLSLLDTASPCHLDFSEAQRDHRLYYCLAWQNTRGEKGPWSEIMSVIIP